MYNVFIQCTHITKCHNSGYRRICTGLPHTKIRRGTHSPCGLSVSDKIPCLGKFTLIGTMLRLVQWVSQSRVTCPTPHYTRPRQCRRLATPSTYSTAPTVTTHRWRQHRALTGDQATEYWRTPAVSWPPTGRNARHTKTHIHFAILPTSWEAELTRRGPDWSYTNTHRLITNNSLRRHGTSENITEIPTCNQQSLITVIFYWNYFPFSFFLVKITPGLVMFGCGQSTW